MGEEDLEDLKVKKDDVELTEKNLQMLKHRKHSQGLAYLLDKNILGDILHECLKERLRVLEESLHFKHKESPKPSTSKQKPLFPFKPIFKVVSDASNPSKKN